jgi:acetyl esterase
MRASGGKPVHETPLSELRPAIRTMSQQLGGPPVAVHSVTNRTVRGPSGEFGIRIYTPRTLNAGERLPIILHYHGGGWVAGDLDSHDTISRYYCVHADAIVVSVDYRLAPEHKFPAAVDDCFAALMWVADHARELGGDSDRIAVTGDSAGGSLSAVVCQLAKARGGAPRIAFQALLYPSVDLDSTSDYPSRRQFGGGEYFLSAADMSYFATQYLNNQASEGKDPRASPIAGRDLAALPPALVVTAGFDPLRDEGKAYADRLAAAGVPAEYRCVDGTIHAFVSFSGAIPAGTEALAFIASRLRRALHPGSIAAS